ncbi:MAG: hypothetical protein PHN78_04900, partial [Dehalococcoidales bacterium]|nr:hypothetical protein [Dehalococcoidales bacterium]
MNSISYWDKKIIGYTDGYSGFSTEEQDARLLLFDSLDGEQLDKNITPLLKLEQIEYMLGELEG